MKPIDMGVINTLLTAALIQVKLSCVLLLLTIKFKMFCFFLRHLGVKIEGIGTTTLTVQGVEEINIETEWFNSKDPIESMFFIAAAAVTGGDVLIKRLPNELLAS